MDAQFPMCRSTQCPSSAICFRHGASGTEPTPGRRYGRFDEFLVGLSISWRSCVHFLPMLNADGKVLLPTRTERLLVNWNTSSARSSASEITDEEKVDAGWEVDGYFATEREERQATWQRRARWLKDYPPRPSS